MVVRMGLDDRNTFSVPCRKEIIGQRQGREKNFEPGAPYVATISIIRFCAQWKSWTLGLLGG